MLLYVDLLAQFKPCCIPSGCQLWWLVLHHLACLSVGVWGVRGICSWWSTCWLVCSLVQVLVYHSSFWWRRRTWHRGSWTVRWFLVLDVCWRISWVLLVLSLIVWWSCWLVSLVLQVLVQFCGSTVALVGTSSVLGRWRCRRTFYMGERFTCPLWLVWWSPSSLWLRWQILLCLCCLFTVRWVVAGSWSSLWPNQSVVVHWQTTGSLV